MYNQKLFIGSYAPFWHNGSTITLKSYNIMLAALPAVLFGVIRYGVSALAVLAFSVSCAMFWEILMNYAMKREVSIGDGNAAVIGLIFAMMLPATAPWWFVLVGTFVAIVIGKQIFGGIGCNPFNPALIAMAVLTLSWKNYLNFDAALVNYDADFYMAYPLGALKHFGVSTSYNYSLSGLLMGQQAGAIGTTCGLALIIGGIYLILRGYIRWEIPVSFVMGVLITAWIFHAADPSKYASPMFQLLTGYTLFGAFFLATEDSSSPVNFVPMLIYGAMAGLMIVLIRNIGAYIDGTVFAILVLNLVNPLIDKIRPMAMGKGIEHA